MKKNINNFYECVYTLGERAKYSKIWIMFIFVIMDMSAQDIFLYLQPNQKFQVRLSKDTDQGAPERRATQDDIKIIAENFAREHAVEQQKFTGVDPKGNGYFIFKAPSDKKIALTEYGRVSNPSQLEFFYTVVNPDIENPIGFYVLTKNTYSVSINDEQKEEIARKLCEKAGYTYNQNVKPFFSKSQLGKLVFACERNQTPQIISTEPEQKEEMAYDQASPVLLQKDKRSKQEKAAERSSLLQNVNLYAVLGIKPGASKKEVNDAYTIVKKRTEIEKDPETLKYANLALDTLTDPSKRKEYEELRRATDLMSAKIAIQIPGQNPLSLTPDQNNQTFSSFTNIINGYYVFYAVPKEWHVEGLGEEAIKVMMIFNDNASTFDREFYDRRMKDTYSSKSRFPEEVEIKSGEVNWLVSHNGKKFEIPTGFIFKLSNGKRYSARTKLVIDENNKYNKELAGQISLISVNPYRYLNPSGDENQKEYELAAEGRTMCNKMRLKYLEKSAEQSADGRIIVSCQTA